MDFEDARNSLMRTPEGVVQLRRQDETGLAAVFFSARTPNLAFVLASAPGGDCGTTKTGQQAGRLGDVIKDRLWNEDEPGLVLWQISAVR